MVRGMEWGDLIEVSSLNFGLAPIASSVGHQKAQLRKRQMCRCIRAYSAKSAGVLRNGVWGKVWVDGK